MISTNDPKDQGSAQPKAFQPYNVLPKKHTVRLHQMYAYCVLRKIKKGFVASAKDYLAQHPELILRITEQGLDVGYFLYGLEYVFSTENKE